MAELSLPALVRRLVDCHPWVKQRMHRQASSAAASSSSAAAPSAASAPQPSAYGDLGAALVREAALFDAAFDDGGASSGQNGRGGGMGGGDDDEDPERAWRGAVAAQEGGEEEGVEEYEGEDPAVAKRAAKAAAFLDHLTVAAEEDAPIGTQALWGKKTQRSSRKAACAFTSNFAFLHTLGSHCLAHRSHLSWLVACTGGERQPSNRRRQRRQR